MYWRIKQFQSMTAEKFTLVLPVVVLCVILSGLFVYASWYMPEHRDVAVDVPWYSLDGRYEYRAIVSEQNPLWPVGTTLVDNPVYFPAATPRLQTTFSLLAEGEAVDLNVVSYTAAVLSMKEADTTYWSKEVVITEDTGLMQSGVYQNSFTLDVGDMQQQLNGIREYLGFQRGTPVVDLVTTVLFTGTVDGRTVAEHRVYSMPITLGTGHYSISDNRSFTETVRVRQTETIEVYPPVHQQYAAVLLLLISVGMLLWVVTSRSPRFKPSADTLQALEREAMHARYRDWMSQGRFDHSITAHRIELGSLEDIISAAVDMNQRVIYDEDGRIYFFVHNNILYSYEPA
ncbi:MAG: DUF5305 domain-containing protein [Methanomicrobiales archaeon]|nr:DUF5305 domain-containing protein [Methanomicrobiales archaeon]